MAVYMVVSVLSGVICAVTSLFFFDGGFWTSVMWYMFGCWAGFAIAFAAIVLSITRRGPDAPEMHPEFT